MSDLIDAASKTDSVGNAPDLANEYTRKEIAKRVLNDIDGYCQKTYDNGHRNHLGASIIGHVCERYLFNTFRWIKHEKTSGRLQRLFNRGHREEERFTEWLRGIGCEVWDKSDNGEQFRVNGVMGHFGGSLDAIYKLPDSYGVPFAMLGEDKTNGTGKGFTDLIEKGVKFAKPQHYAQMCIYGKNYELHYALYMCINKNDDDLHVEIVALDWALAERLEAKAERVIKAKTPPEKYALSEAVFECKYCKFKGICHNSEKAEKNCRSCIHAEAVDNGQWKCNNYAQIIPNDFIKAGCDNWGAIV